MAYMSQEGYDKLVAELKRLESVGALRHRQQSPRQPTRVI